MKKIFIIFGTLIYKLFYKSKYLKGKNFENKTDGIKACHKFWFDQKIKGFNRHCPFPVNPTTTIGNIKNLYFDIDDIDNFWKVGCYYQCWKGQIFIGKGTWIAQNVGIITENHNPDNLDMHLPAQDVHIGKNCWIGMNSVILPGVTLGDKTIVGAGTVVTHSFPEGNCVIAGTPAKIIKRLENNLNESNKKNFS
mgnify:CR=1 FL=1